MHEILNNDDERNVPVVISINTGGGTRTRKRYRIKCLATTCLIISLVLATIYLFHGISQSGSEKPVEMISGDEEIQIIPYNVNNEMLSENMLMKWSDKEKASENREKESTLTVHQILKRDTNQVFMSNLQDVLKTKCNLNSNNEECQNQLIDLYATQRKIWENITRSLENSDFGNDFNNGQNINHETESNTSLVKERATANNPEDGRLQLPSETMKAASQVFHNPSSSIPPNIPTNCFSPNQFNIPPMISGYSVPVGYPMMGYNPPMQQGFISQYPNFNTMPGPQNNPGWWPVAVSGQPFICVNAWNSGGFSSNPGIPDFRNVMQTSETQKINTADENGNNKRYIKTSNQVEEPISIHYKNAVEYANKSYGHTINSNTRNVEDCDKGKKKCLSGECIKKSKWCDIVVDCMDASDETSCPCKSRIDPSRICDGFFDCPFGEEELGCFNCDPLSFSCNEWSRTTKKSKCFKLDQRCDGENDCNNKLDERECTMLHKSLDHHATFEIAHSKGFLHKNFKGKWYPVCGMPYKLALDACVIENNDIDSTPFLQLLPKPENFNGKFILWDDATGKNGEVEFIDDCQNGSALFVICPQPKCGIKTQVSQMLRKTSSDDLYDRSLGRHKRSYEYVLESDPIIYELDENFIAQYFPDLDLVPVDIIKVPEPIEGDHIIQHFPYEIPQYYSVPPPPPPPLPVYNNIREENYFNQPYHYEQSLDDRDFFPNKQESWNQNQFVMSPSNVVEIPKPPNSKPSNNKDFENDNFRIKIEIPSEPIKSSDNSINIATSEKTTTESSTENIMKEIKSSEELTNDNKTDPIVGIVDMRIVGGKLSSPAAWPWIVGIYKNGLFSCGGSIINEKWILTAGHCTMMYRQNYYEVSAGMLRRFSFSPQEQVSTVELIFRHEQFDRATMHNDLSLLKLKTPLAMNRWARPICLPSVETAGTSWLWGPPPGIMCMVVGWGANVESGANPDHLREVEVPVLSHCKSKDDEDGKEICAGYEEGGKDACQGDSGGPFLCKNPLNNNQWYVAGIVSHGEGCARPGVPGAYTRVSLYNHWITDTIAGQHVPAEKPKQKCPGFTCIWGVRRCIPKARVCDKIVDCLGGEDEHNCKKQDDLRTKIDEEVEFHEALWDVLFPHHNNQSRQANSTTLSTAGIIESLNNLSDRRDHDKMTSKPPTMNVENEMDKFPVSPFIDENDKKEIDSEDIVEASGNGDLIGALNESLPIPNVNGPEIEKSEFININNESLQINNEQDFQQISKNATKLNEINDQKDEDKNKTFDDDEESKRIDETEENNDDTEEKDEENQDDENNEDEENLNSNSNQNNPNEESQGEEKNEPNNQSEESQEEENNEPNNEQDNLDEKEDDKNNESEDNKNNGINEEDEIIKTNDKKTDNEESQENNHNGNDQNDTNLKPDHKLNEGILDSEKLNTTATQTTEKHDNSESHLIEKGRPKNDVNNLPLNSQDDQFDSHEKVLNVTKLSESIEMKNDKNILMHSKEDQLGLIKSRNITLNRKSPIFKCLKYNQTLSWEKRCNFIIDCEDGSDEHNCTCTEILNSHLSTGLCDNYMDCADGSDEINCDFCKRDEFYCTTSKTCIKLNKVCDRNKDCEFGEDELECFALNPGGNVLIDKDFKPQLHSEGEIVMFNNGQWEAICEIDWNPNKMAATAIHICNYLGFGNAMFYNPTQNNTNDCNNLFVKCDISSNSDFMNLTSNNQNMIIYDQQSLNIDKLTMMPWISRLYVNGKCECTGVLINYSWILVEEECGNALISKEANIFAVMGNKRTIPGISSPFEQYSMVDIIYPITAFPLKMLHLKNAFTLSRYVKPVKLPPSDKGRLKNNEICTISSVNEEGVPVNIHLLPVTYNCKPFGRCFKKISNTPCQEYDDLGGDSCKWSGLVVCYYSDYGWYAAATYNEPHGYCGFDNLDYSDIYFRSEEIALNMDKEIDSYKKISSTGCIGVQCPLGECIPLLNVCDGISDCYNGADEQETNCISKRNFCFSNSNHPECGCNRLQLRCKNGQCIDKMHFKNDVSACYDKSDKLYPQGTSECFIYLQMTQPNLICDGVTHCEDRSDEDPNVCGCEGDVFVCPTDDFPQCIPNDAVCDQRFDCPGGEDEIDCEAIRPIGESYGIGEIIERKFGFWQPKCFDRNNYTKTELENICTSLGFTSGHAVLIKPDFIENYDAAPLTFVSIDGFSSVTLNNHTFRFRNKNKPYATKKPIGNRICHRLYLECI